jgi:hypothetical protein
VQIAGQAAAFCRDLCKGSVYEAIAVIKLAENKPMNARTTSSDRTDGSLFEL